MRSSKNVISIIVPIYKVEQYLRKSLDSIKNQTYKDFEVILVDDGSPDNSAAICEEYVSEDSRFRLVRKENGGLSSARNAGIDNAKGEYITFVDSDDWIDEHYLERLYNLKIENNADIAVVDIMRYSEEKGFYKEDTCAPEGVHVFTGPEFVRLMNRSKKQIGNYAPGKLFDKHLLPSGMYPIGKTYEDAFAIPYVVYGVSKVVYSSENLYFYLMRSDSIVHREYLSCDHIEALIKIEEFAEKQKDHRLCWNLRYTLIRYYLGMPFILRKYGGDSKRVWALGRKSVARWWWKWLLYFI